MAARLVSAQDFQFVERTNSREVTSGFRYLDLLFSEEPSEGNDIWVDVLLAHSAVIAA